MDEEFKERLQRDYRSFYKSEKIYKDLQVPWKRGLIFLGVCHPFLSCSRTDGVATWKWKDHKLKGNHARVKGPCTLRQVFPQYVSFPSYTQADHPDWAGDEAGIKAIFERARAEAPCLLVLEDLDSLITDMNRSFFLNEVDGIDGNDGLLLVSLLILSGI